MKEVLHYSNRLSDLVSASVEGIDVSNEHEHAQENDIDEDHDGDKEKKTENVIKESSTTTAAFQKIIDSLNLVFQRASPVIPDYVWSMLQRCPSYFGNDSVTFKYVVRTVVKDMLTSARIEILKHLYRLKNMLLIEGGTKQENKWVYSTMCDLIAPYDVTKHTLIFTVFDVCCDFKSNAHMLDSKDTFSEMHQKSMPTTLSKN